MRELCDVCYTTVFNYHWSCDQCGFTVCADCHRFNGQNVAEAWNIGGVASHNHNWLTCADGKPHKQNELTLVQIIVGDLFNELATQMHIKCKLFNITHNCDCPIMNSLSTGNVDTSLYTKRDVENRLLNNTSSIVDGDPGDASCSWFMNGKLLMLTNPTHADNLKNFQNNWSNGQPVVVSNVTDSMNMEMWRPEYFSKYFGEESIDMVDSTNGDVLQNQPMKCLWDGFECVSQHLNDRTGSPILLKVKDWPSNEDFALKMPEHFEDLMKSLPLSDYTKRNGVFNLITYLPDCFLMPDLGPKLYIAYGSTKRLQKGTTNIHLDISDAVNLMTYVAVPKIEIDREQYMEEVYQAMADAGCDPLMTRYVRENNKLPGAIWHIFAPDDAIKIRQLLSKVADECKMTLKQDHVVIHDQNWYLNDELRERLFNDYAVVGYSIVQCLGDAIFIPAGAPHQVRNLTSCIKVAEDFVSPENVSNCLNLTHQFRTLSSSHSNHEDKLQMKNILYHTIKDTVGRLCIPPQTKAQLKSYVDKNGQ